MFTAIIRKESGKKLERPQPIEKGIVLRLTTHLRIIIWVVIASIDFLTRKKVARKEIKYGQYSVQVRRYTSKFLIYDIGIFGVSHRIGVQVHNILQKKFKQRICNDFIRTKKQFHMLTFIKGKHIQKAQ